MSYDTREKVIELIIEERRRQIYNPGVFDTAGRAHTREDWIVAINACAGLAVDKAMHGEKQYFFDSVVKVAALCVAAMEAHLDGYC